MSRLPRSLWGRLVFSLGLALSLYTLIAVAAVFYFVVFPVGQRSADDLAALIVLSARTWRELPPETHADFRTELVSQHGLYVADTLSPRVPVTPSRPYLRFLHAALVRRSGDDARLFEGHGARLWAAIPVSRETVFIGFDAQRQGARPPGVLLLLLGLGMLVTLALSTWLVRQLARPLSLLAARADALGRGQTPAPVPEQGATEVVALARNFNRMAVNLRALLDNRTVLLGGVSHDLRTPLTRLRLALEMLPADADLALVASMRDDLEAMQRLLTQSLELARGLDDQREEPVDLAALVGEIVSAQRARGQTVAMTVRGVCGACDHPTALRRMLLNLLENAARYGGDGGIEVDLDCAARRTDITVADRGPGIPAAERDAVFRPFYRLEASRSQATGGSGLGLAIVRQLAEHHGWDVRLEDREGGGLRVRVSRVVDD